MPDSDDHLIRRAQQGDRGAFEELVHRYDEDVLKLALGYTRCPEDARDIYQEVFLRVYRSLNGFRFESSFSTWLYRIATITCLSFRSKHSREQFVSYEEAGGQRQSDPDSMAAIGHTENGYEGVAASEIALEIDRALKELSPRQQLIFILKHFHGLKLREIASILNCSEGTAKKHFFVATQRMRARLAEFVHHGD